MFFCCCGCFFQFVKVKLSRGYICCRLKGGREKKNGGLFSWIYISLVFGYSPPGGGMGPPEFMFGLIWAWCRPAIGGGAGLPAEEGGTADDGTPEWGPWAVAAKFVGKEGRSSSLS